MIRAIIFDCFGVLVTDALQAIYDELNISDPQAAAQISDLVRASNKGLLDPEWSNQQIAEILGVSLAEYQQRIRYGEAKNTQLLAYINELHAQYKTAILSNISATGLAKRFTSAELRDCFDTVVSSGEIGFAKPEAEAYEIAADRLGVRLDECVFTDDKAEFCEAARRVGMQAIVFESTAQFRRDLSTLMTTSN